MKINFYNHFFTIVLISSLLVVIFLSYNRFFIKHDYVIGYESQCDPILKSCFIGCEDDECTKEYYYFKMQKYASDLYLQCGKNIENCDLAKECLINDRYCFATYCDVSKGNVCETLTKEEDNLKTKDSNDLIIKNNINKI